MQQSSINTRAILIYGLVGIALLVLIVFGISWAKNRSQQVASQTQNQTAQNQGQQPSGSGQNQNNGGDQNPPQNQPTDNTASTSSGGGDQEVDGHVSGAATTGPHIVPAAGASDWPVFMGAISLAAYAGVKFAQSRRRLLGIR
jgi:hypothetical protein